MCYMSTLAASNFAHFFLVSLEISLLKFDVID